MDYYFKRCIEKKNIVKADTDKELIKKELAAAESDLKDSKDIFSIGKHKLTTIAAYYCMFHAARALLYSKGYREKSHFCLRTAIKNLFVDTNMLESSFLDDYDMAKDLRENADYKSDFSKEGAKQLIVTAEKFLEKTKFLLKDILSS